MIEYDYSALGFAVVIASEIVKTLLKAQKNYKKNGEKQGIGDENHNQMQRTAEKVSGQKMKQKTWPAMSQSWRRTLLGFKEARDAARSSACR